jgi:hypothetical protein
MTIVDRDQLLDSARDFAERALKAHSESDDRVVLVNAAFSMEHLTKAYLYNMHPALLTDLRNGQLDALLHLVDLGNRARKATFPRTISAKEALARVEHVLPNLTVPKDLLHQLVEVRDGVVHVGYLSSASTVEILAAFLRFAEALHDELGTPERERWGDYFPLVDTLITQTLDAVALRVQRKLAVARRRYNDLTHGLSEEERKTFQLRRWSDSYRTRDGEPDDQQTVFIDCPACGADHAYLRGDSQIDPKFGKYEEIDGHPAWPEIYARFVITADGFMCPACDLLLDSTDEVKAAGLETSLEAWYLLWNERFSELGRAFEDETVREYREFKPLGSRQPPYPLNSEGYYAAPAKRDHQG